MGYFSRITCPSRNTVIKNKLKDAIIISNFVFPEKYIGLNKKFRKPKNKILFVAYSSGGGGKYKKIRKKYPDFVL